MALILASGSPRRRELMALITPDYTVITSDVDEGKIAADTPAHLAQSLASAKAALWPNCTRRIPSSALIPWWTAAVRYSGNPRMKPTPCACCGHSPAAPTRCTPASASARGGRAAATVETTLVHFSTIVEDDLRAYVRTPEPYDKAGAYAIQGHAALWCAGIEGCYYNIMGLPVHRAAQLLREFA